VFRLERGEPANGAGPENNASSGVTQRALSLQDYKNLTLDDWLAKFGRIYGKRHEKHTTEYMVSRLVEEIAELVNPMEAQNREQIGPSLADVFSWTCSLAFKLNIDLSTLAWKKYGMNAPHASSGSSNPSLQSFSQPQTLQQWQLFISKLYQEENARLTPMAALVAMMKDVGDLAMLNRKRTTGDQVTSKLAAILAWTLTISQLLQLDLTSVTFEKYDDHCPVCGNAICDTDICHPLKTMYVSFGDSATDEEKYAILDTATRCGFETLLNSASTLQRTSDLSKSLDLINRSDAACILFTSINEQQSNSEYRQIFETLACHSILSKGNVWVYARGEMADFPEFLRITFSPEGVSSVSYSEVSQLRRLFQTSLDELRKRSASES
jgi:NTP pyrophosphatase (non-canonical NTP hydrolase)